MFSVDFQDFENFDKRKDYINNLSFDFIQFDNFDLEYNKYVLNFVDDEFQKQNLNEIDFEGKNDSSQKINLIEDSPKIKKPMNDNHNLETNYKTNKDKIFLCSKEKKRKLGRKRTEIGKHNKFCKDNLTRKLKGKLFDAILNYINASFVTNKFEIFKTNLNIKKKPFFLKIKQDIIKNINVNFNLNLLNSKLKKIFSNEISKKVISFGLNYNKNLIDKIYKENKYHKVIAILEKTFLECLEQFRGTKNYNELKGLEKEYQYVIEDFVNKGESIEYISMFKSFVENFEEYYKVKKGKK